MEKRRSWSAGHRNFTSLHLDPLSEPAMTELLDGFVPGLPEELRAQILARAEGVPLYAVETVRGLLADGRIKLSGDVYEPTADLSSIRVPDSLRSLIASRLDALEPTDRSLLQDAAVLGQVFSADALGAITGVASDELDMRLRTLVRRELLELETDPRSPERGQYRFVQSLIREVAYGMLARRDRRARHLAVARHYESVGDDELAGALANHYLAARDTSDEGPEADAITTQARLALSGAADRAAALGAHEQAVAYLDQALAITSDLSDRAPLLDRAARSAVHAARAAVRYAEEAIDAYHQLGDQVAAAGAIARLGKVLLDTGEVVRATEVLEAAALEAESIGDQPVFAQILAYLSRAYMRRGVADKAVEAADRALPIAERLNLDAIVAEAFVNKGSALGMAGRRRESVALQQAAVEMATAGSDRDFEMRARNNFASSISEDDPARATRLFIETAELARQVGNRYTYNWAIGTAAAFLYGEGHDWDAHAAVMREALEGATLAHDRLRLRILLALLETPRGERTSELVAELTELVGDSTEPDDLFALYMARGDAALVSGDTDTAYSDAMLAVEVQSQNPEVPLSLAARAAIWSKNLDRARQTAAHRASLPSTGAFSQAELARQEAAVAALEGRTADAVAGFRDARERLVRLEQMFEAATTVVDAAVLLPGEREVQAWAAEVRPFLEDLRARPFVDKLDEALASVQPAATLAARPTARTGAETPTA
jgi:tetratricopeptide (TPR) repeat protein